MAKQQAPDGAGSAAGKVPEAAAREAGMISMRRVNQVLFAVALIALLAMLRRIDWPVLLDSFSRVGMRWPLLFIPYGFACFFWTISWRTLLIEKKGRPPLHRLFFLRLAGDSLNQLTPTASLGGEPFKVVRLQAGGFDWEKATASVVIHKVLMVLSLVLYVFLCFLLIPVALPQISHRVLFFSCIGSLMLGGGGLIFLTLQRHNPCVSFMRLLQRFGVCPAALSAKEEQLAALDATLAGFYRDHPGAVMIAFFFFLVGWMCQTCEVYLIFRILGHAIDLPVALCLDALAQLVAGLGFMIPGSLGVQDGGNVLLSLGFNLGATLGAGFSILRRFREAFWLLLGLLVLPWER